MKNALGSLVTLTAALAVGGCAQKESADASKPSIVSTATADVQARISALEEHEKEKEIERAREYYERACNDLGEIVNPNLSEIRVLDLALARDLWDQGERVKAIRQYTRAIVRTLDAIASEEELENAGEVKRIGKQFTMILEERAAKFDALPPEEQGKAIAEAEAEVKAYPPLKPWLDSLVEKFKKSHTFEGGDLGQPPNGEDADKGILFKSRPLDGCYRPGDRP